MYQYFCDSIKNYIKYNECEQHQDEFRCKVALPLMLFTDIEQYRRLKVLDDRRYREVSNLLYRLNQRKLENRRLDVICYELWGMDFESIAFEGFDNEVVQEQIKLCELFVTSPAYWNE